MKVLLFTDLHGQVGKIKQLVETAKKENVSAIVCAGDLTFFGSNISELIRKFDIGVPLVVIPGNHELPQDMKDMAKKFGFVKNIHSSSFVLDSCIFIGLGGSKTTPFSTPFELDDREIEKKLGKFGKKGKRKLVFVVHEPPLNTALDSIDGMHLGSNAIRKFIETQQPDFCVCGHFHENAGKEDKIHRTTIINPGAVGRFIRI